MYINIHILRINLLPKENIMKSGAIRNIIRDKNDRDPNIWFSSGEKVQLYQFNPPKL